MATSGFVVSLKLLIDTKNKRVLFAEAEKDFVTFLHDLLSLSAGTVFKLLNKRPILDDDRVENQSLCNFAPQSTPAFGSISAPVFGSVDSRTAPISSDRLHMVMDDLTVKPMSTVSCSALLTEFTANEVGPLEERVVHFGLYEGLKLLKATLQTNMALTSVFLGGMETNDASSASP
ncbi:hypothetical protein Vadar_028406 [Vaccinium darrowii]|uniref:Uncharacterized protein n=1 Tax=Vaccinium darrowii TaxID=229202 RepID=A0ACB7XKK6_9ERIC|nr:hypothetical protein Vadar_028406 [Vaccinium darrowii]